MGGIGKPGSGSRRYCRYRCKRGGGSICLHMRRLYLLADRNVDARTSPNNQENQDHEQNCLEPGDTPVPVILRIFLYFPCGINRWGPIDRAQRRGPACSIRQVCFLRVTSGVRWAARTRQHGFLRFTLAAHTVGARLIAPILLSDDEGNYERACRCARSSLLNHTIQADNLAIVRTGLYRHDHAPSAGKRQRAEGTSYSLRRTNSQRSSQLRTG